MLQSQFRVRIPTRIEKHKQRLDVVPRRDFKELIDALLESDGILLPQQVMEENPHRVHPQTLRPTKLFVDLGGVETLRLPHFQLVDRVFRNVVAADQPRLPVIPSLRFLPAPAGYLREQRT